MANDDFLLKFGELTVTNTVTDEDKAKEFGCKYVFLDTFSFQALLFYKKYGYEQVFQLDNYPRTGKRHYFVKKL